MTTTAAPATVAVTLAVDDGTEMVAHVARPANPTGSGILVFQEAFGVNDHIKDLADRFANVGFLAIAPEMYHRTGGVGATMKYGDMDAVRPHSGAMTTEGIMADVRAAYGWLIANGAAADKIASTGYCQGGRVSYIANATVPLAGAVSYYGGNIPSILDLAPKQHGPNLMFWGGLDKNITPDIYRSVADALTAAGHEHTQVVFSYAEHGFFCDARPSYSAKASQQAWALTLEFFRANGVL